MTRKRGEGVRQPSDSRGEIETNEARTLVRHEEALEVDKLVETGAVRARKVVESERVTQSVPVTRELVELEHLPALENDSGRLERLPDGSISVPVFAEEIAVRTHIVVKERVRITKRTVTDEETVAADVARERVEIEADPDVEVREVGSAAAAAGPAGDAAVGGSSPSFVGRRSFATSELIALVAVLAAVVICTALFAALDLWRGLILAAALVGAYMVGRGFAKSRSPQTEPLVGDGRSSRRITGR